MKTSLACVTAIGLSLLLTAPVPAAVLYSNLAPNGALGIASRPATSPYEIETADDFLLTSQASITSASFIGLLAGGARAADVQQVVIEIYRIFPKDSDVSRTSGAPTFSTTQVPTRVNSPSDVAYTSRDSVGSGLSFSATTLTNSFTASNSVAAGGIHPLPGDTTGGNGPIEGQEVQFDVSFTTPFDLPADHYFFVPQVGLSNGDFYWLSALRPIVSPGTPFAPDLQVWTRDARLDPDWLRVGTDIIGAGTFNAAFAINGTVSAVPEPAPVVLMLGVAALLGLAAIGRRSRVDGWRRSLVRR